MLWTYAEALKIPFSKLFGKYSAADVVSVLKDISCGLLVPDKNNNLAGETDI